MPADWLPRLRRRGAGGAPAVAAPGRKKGTNIFKKNNFSGFFGGRIPGPLLITTPLSGTETGPRIRPPFGRISGRRFCKKAAQGGNSGRETRGWARAGGRAGRPAGPGGPRGGGRQEGRQGGRPGGWKRGRETAPKRSQALPLATRALPGVFLHPVGEGRGAVGRRGDGEGEEGGGGNFLTSFVLWSPWFFLVKLYFFRFAFEGREGPSCFSGGSLY